jgi:NAD-dependent dihydropyrimidine dehydrogenase PreA subunit
VIALLLEDRCTGCNACVAVCPTNVFETRVDASPVIARQEDCETCFLCELYCPADALYVEPTANQIVDVDEEQIKGSGLLGQFRRESGWGEWEADPRYTNEHWRMGQIFERARRS